MGGQVTLRAADFLGGTGSTPCTEQNIIANMTNYRLVVERGGC